MSLAQTVSVDDEELVAAPNQAFQQLWFTAEETRWTSLVIVPAAASGTSERVAAALTAVGAAIEPGAVGLLSACGARLTELPRMLSAMRAARSGGPRVVVACDSVLANPVGIALARAADAVLLCVPLGSAELEPAKRSLELIGAERLIGCVAVTPRSGR